MRGERYVLLGLAPPRSRWFVDLATWSTSGAVPAEFVKSVTAEEAAARLRGGRRFSALIVEGTMLGWDRDTLDLAASRGCAVIIVDGGGDGGDPHRAWDELGAHAVVPAGFGRDRLMEVLRSVASPVPRADDGAPGGLPGAGTQVGGEPAGAAPGTDRGWRGRLVAVTGAAGTGRSTLAMALAGGLAADPRDRGLVVLADLALDAQQALLHDAGDVVPGLAELVDAHRRGSPDGVEVRRLCFDTGDRGYDLLLGLRRHRDWTALRPRALQAALDALRGSYRVVVADVDADVEGQAECGLADIEERNQLARATLGGADAVLVAGRAGLGGLHAHLRVIADLLGFGVEGRRILPVVNRAPRHPGRRAETAASLVRLVGEVAPEARLAANPIFVPDRRRLDDVVADGGRLPGSVATPVTTAARALLERVPPARPGVGPDSTTPGGSPVAVAPGTVGTWADVTGDLT